MKHNFIKRMITLSLISATLLTILPISASAEWRQDSTGWWNTEGDSWSIGWRQINGKWYYFNNNGYMVTNTNIGGYQIDNNGVWIQNTNTTVNNNTNSNNTTTTSNVANTNITNNVNSNNTTNVNNNINNGIVINGNINIGDTNTNTSNNSNSNVNADSSQSDSVKAFDGANGFKKIDDNKYQYFENGKMLVNTWKKFDNGYRHFDKNGYLSIGKTVDGLNIGQKGLIPLVDEHSYKQKALFINLKPYGTSVSGNYGDGTLNYITNTYDTFGIKYSIEYQDVYNEKDDGTIRSINDKYKNFDSDKFDAIKIIQVGKYKDRLNLN